MTPYSMYCIPSKSSPNAIMISTLAVMVKTKGSSVKKLAICLRLKIMHNVIKIWTSTAITVITLNYFFANFGLFAPISLPIRAQKASCIPIGIIKTKVLMLSEITTAACSLTPIFPDKNTMISNDHHSAQSITVAGTESLKYSSHPLNDSIVGKNTHSRIFGIKQVLAVIMKN